MLGPARRAVNEARARVRPARAGLGGPAGGAGGRPGLRAAVRRARATTSASRSGWRRPWRPSTSGTAWCARPGPARPARRPCCACCGAGLRRGGGAAGAAAADLARQRAARPQLQLRGRVRLLRAAAARDRGRTRRPPGVLAGVAVAAAARAPARVRDPGRCRSLWSLLRLYRDPPVFAFDPFGGYFPGPIYDEALRPPATLLVFRLVNLVWIATAVAIGLAAVGRGWNPRRWRRRRAGRRAAAAGGVGRAVRDGRPPAVPHHARRSRARARSHADDRALRPALRAAGRRRAPTSR